MLSCSQIPAQVFAAGDLVVATGRVTLRASERPGARRDPDSASGPDAGGRFRPLGLVAHFQGTLPVGEPCGDTAPPHTALWLAELSGTPCQVWHLLWPHTESLGAGRWSCPRGRACTPPGLSLGVVGMGLLSLPTELTGCLRPCSHLPLF